MAKSWFEPEQRWLLVHSWIEHCFSQHKECKRTGRPRLPTRCLDIGAHEHDIIRVLTPSREVGRYACLSHCWGGHQPCTLTSATLPVYSQGIPASELPQTYKDAIAICRLLGLRYIWVDSLCILQNDKDDWLRESPKMVDYYGNCHVCIAATNVSGPNAGLKIRDRPAGIRVDGIGAEGHRYQLLAYPSDLIGTVSHFSRADAAKLEQNFPLMKRAWVLQERWLSPRTLHFCGDEVVLECGQDLKCECGRNNETFTLWKGDPTKVMPIENQSDGMVLKRQSGKRWTQFVSAYSALDLSFRSDRLPAVSGLARRFAAQHTDAQRSPGRYLAGLWQHTLHDELVWFVGDVLLQAQRSTEADDHQLHTGLALAKRGRLVEYIAPSWSWAGVTDAVSYRAWNDNAPLCELISADVVLSGTDPFGAVAPGCTLTIRGKLFETAWTVTGVQSKQKSFVLSDMHATQRLDNKNSDGVRFLPDYTITKPRPNQITASERLYVFPVLTQKLSLSSWSYNMNEERAMQDMMALVERVRNTASLVLRRRRSSTDGLAVFERVGFTEYASVTAHAENLDLNPYEEQTFILI
ncbi:hypothetical protein LTR85_003797 [Meristemomyces frigidus]|nr:hypothetical protein LTR85_003797 [Meristemomyces frigidus]